MGAVLISADAWVRIASLCVLLAGAETLHGIARTLWVVPRLGKVRAIQLSAVTGSLLALAICLWLVPSMRLQGALAYWVLGAVLVAFMAGFDIAMGLLVLRKPWRKVWPDFDPRTGNFLLFGLAFLLAVPTLVRLIRGLP